MGGLLLTPALLNFLPLQLPVMQSRFPAARACTLHSGHFLCSRPDGLNNGLTGVNLILIAAPLSAVAVADLLLIYCMTGEDIPGNLAGLIPGNLGMKPWEWIP